MSDVNDILDALDKYGHRLHETLKGGDFLDGKRLKGLASDSGIKERTLYRAAKDIGVVMLPGGFGKARRWHLCPTPGKGCYVCRSPEDKPKPLPHDDLGTHEDPTLLEPSCGAGSSHVCHGVVGRGHSDPDPDIGEGSV